MSAPVYKQIKWLKDLSTMEKNITNAEYTCAESDSHSKALTA